MTSAENMFWKNRMTRVGIKPGFATAKVTLLLLKNLNYDRIDIWYCKCLLFYAPTNEKLQNFNAN